MSGAISPSGTKEEYVDFGGGAIPVSVAKNFAEFLKEDTHIGIKVSLRKSPREILEEAAGKREWFKAIILAAAFLEHFSSIILNRRTNGGINNDSLNLRLENLLRLLLDFQLVSGKIYSKMQDIKSTRNKLVHNPFAAMDESVAKRLIANAVECLESLGVAD